MLDAEPSLANHHLPEDAAPTPLYCLPDDEDAAVDAVRILLAHGADPSVRNGKGHVAAGAARARGLDEAAEIIEGAGHAR